VTIQLPDLNELAAQAKPALGVGFAKPVGSLMVSGKDDGTPVKQGQSTKFEICFFPIPLITIVATFVFQLFLPIIMLLFQLWWMLALKLCIPPEVSLDASITAEIDVSGKIGIAADLDVDATIEANVAGAIQSTLTAQIGAAGSAALLADYSPIAVANVEIESASAAKVSNASPGAQPGVAANPVSVVANLQFEPEVAHA